MRDWTVVGIFDAGNTGYNSEIWGDADQFMQAFRRPVYSSVLFKLRDSPEFQGFKERIESDPRLTTRGKKGNKILHGPVRDDGNIFKYSRLVAYNNLLPRGCCRRHDYYVCGSS